MLKTIVFQEIKNYASIIALDHHLVDPLASDTFFLTKKTSAVSLAHSLNMTVYYYFLSNEFNAYAFDYRSDPILQINSVISNYNVDGFITDFPATLYNFLHSKCWVDSFSGACAFS
jgi:glycerophosphoryl diester phosphodiesterase